MKSTNPTVTFIHVEDNKSKIERLCTAIHRQFAQGYSIIINVPSEEAARYLDQMLWKIPIQSFLPHEIATNKTNAKVAITWSRENFNTAEVLINLCPDTSPEYVHFKKIYDLWDTTDPGKEEFSKKRREKYKELGLPCFKE